MFAPAQANKESQSEIDKFLPSIAATQPPPVPAVKNVECVSNSGQCTTNDVTNGLPYLFPGDTSYSRSKHSPSYNQCWNTYFFPSEWSKLAGRSLEEAALLIDAAAVRLRSSL